MPRVTRIALLALSFALCPKATAQSIGPAPAAAEQTPSTIVRDLGDLPLGIPPQDADTARPTALVRSNDAATPQGAGSGLARTLIALAGVLALILTLAWAFKKVAARSGGLAGAVGAGGRAPAGLVEVLARYPIAGRQTLVVLRFDRRVLLCCMSAGARGASAAMTTLCELQDPEDVASVLLKTRDEAGESIARSFERSLREADEYTQRAEHVRFVPPRAAASASAGDGDGGPLARGLEALWRGGRGG